eukprot:1472974-Amphidinium_carterae.1
MVAELWSVKQRLGTVQETAVLIGLTRFAAGDSRAVPTAPVKELQRFLRGTDTTVLRPPLGADTLASGGIPARSLVGGRERKASCRWSWCSTSTNAVLQSQTRDRLPSPVDAKGIGNPATLSGKEDEWR